MGFFSKIKDNFQHGGITLDFQAPASVSMQDPSLPITVTITSTGEAHTIKGVSAEIIATSRNKSFSQPTISFGNNSAINNTDTQIVTEIVARADNNEQFVIQAGETKTVQVSIVMNTAAAVQDQLPADGVMAQVAGAVQKIGSISQALSGEGWSYELRVKADVDGIALDPAKSHPLQILKPGQIGGAVNL